MKTTLLSLFLVLALLGCHDSGSSPSIGVFPPAPPVIKDKLTFLENSTPYSAIIFDDAASIDEHSTLFFYGIENLTNVAYNNISFAIEPTDSAKYSLSSECTSLAYNASCLVTVKINTKTADEVKFSIKMGSDRGEQTFAVTPIKANYRFQSSENSISLASGTSKTFIVRNSMSHVSLISGDVIYHRNKLSIPASAEHSLEIGTAGFSIATDDVRKELTIDGTKQNVKNCFPAGSTTVLPNAEVNACYVEVLFINASAGKHSDTLTIRGKPIAGRPNIWKDTKIELTSAN